MTHGSDDLPAHDAVAAFFARRNEAWRRLDAAALAADYVADATIDSPFAGRHTSPDAEARLRKFFESFTGLEIEPEDAIIDGQRAAQIATVTGTGTRGLMGLAPTNLPFRFLVAVVYELRGLKIAHEQRIYDSTGLWVQSGLLKVKPQ